MLVTRLSLRNFRSYERAEVRLAPGITVVAGRNGAGKSNLLEAIYFACTGRSCRTANERECVRFGAGVLRLELDAAGRDGGHALTVGFQPGEAKRFTVDGAPVERLADAAVRPLVSVFLPDRLELIAGTPSLRRAHLDQVVAALWPSRAGDAAGVLRRAGATQRARGRDPRRPRRPRLDAGVGQRARPPRDRADGRPRGDRRAAAAGFAEHADGPRASRARRSCATGRARRRRRRRSSRPSWPSVSRATSQRGFTGHGPHRDDLVFGLEGRDLRAYGSRGQQRLALLALLLAEREALGRRARRRAADAARRPDVELDAGRRERLVEVLRARRPERDHGDRARARARVRRRRRRAAWRSSRARCCQSADDEAQAA